MKPFECECAGCPVHSSLSHCGKNARNRILLYRVDTSCSTCADDAFYSGLFAVDFPEDYEFDEADA